MKRIIRLAVLVCLVACLITSRLVGQDSIPVQEQSSKTNDTKTAGVDLDGRRVYPLDEAIDKGVVLVFVDVECPISNRYAPEIQRLHGKFTEKGVRFWLVYPDPLLSADAIRKHVEQYRYRIRILRDPEHALVRRAQVRVTPETAVFGSRGELVYNGRIDDGYV